MRPSGLRDTNTVGCRQVEKRTGKKSKIMAVKKMTSWLRHPEMERITSWCNNSGNESLRLTVGVRCLLLLVKIG